MSMRGARRGDDLSVRPGARFACSGGALCCHDIHRLGPVTEGERRRLAILSRPDATRVVSGRRELSLTPEGACVLLEGDRCSVHRAHGPGEKPALCRKFPFAAIATPLGVRVTTAHRCPCRTMGERPPLSADEARAALADASGRVRAARRAPERLAMGASVSVSFATWTQLEVPIVAGLAAGAPAWEVLDAPRALPALVRVGWGEIAAAFAARGSASRHDVALAHFADGIRLMLGEDPLARSRPWAPIFDAAEARAPRIEPPAAIVGDFLADRVWDLSWIDQGSFALARATLTALAVIALALAARFAASGARPDRAAAEAIFIVELASSNPLWGEVAARVKPAPIGRLFVI
jgi:hypothetical protein